MLQREAAYPFLSLPKERNLFFQPASISPQPRMLAVLLQNIRQTEAGRERGENTHTLHRKRPISHTLGVC